MKIKWFGQLCFRITAENGTKIVMDPYYNMLGYKLPEIDAHIVTTCHNHGDHNNVGAVKGDFMHLKEPGVFSQAGIGMEAKEKMMYAGMMAGMAFNNAGLGYVHAMAHQLNSNIGIEGGLKTMGVEETDIDRLSENALKDICSLTNPRQGSVEGIAHIFKASM